MLTATCIGAKTGGGEIPGGVFPGRIVGVKGCALRFSTPLGLLLTREAEVVGVGELSLSTSPHPPTPASICFHNTLQCCAWNEGELPQRTKFPQTTHLGHQAAHGVGFPQASSPSTLTLTSLRAKDTLSALLSREVTSLVPAAAPLPLELLAAHCCPQHAIPQATW